MQRRLPISTSDPATDLGYLLHKNPARLHRIELAFGEAFVVYPEATDERCTAALVVNVDTVGLVRKGEGRFSQPHPLPIPRERRILRGAELLVQLLFPRTGVIDQHFPPSR